MTARLRISGFIEGPRAQTLITVLIVLNAITLGLETSPDIMLVYGDVLRAFDRLVLSIFVIEIIAKIAGYGYSKRTHFAHPADPQIT